MIYISNNIIKKIVILVAISLFTVNVISQSNDIYHFEITDINGEVFKFNKLKGKKIIIVNTASKCMYTPQYKGLQKIYKKYKKDGLEIIAFPCNDFAKRDPGTNEEIAEFEMNNY